jgi:F0F1-type ATP synthase epsilon subunit
MTDTIKLEIVSAEEQIFSQEVEMVYAPAEMGRSWDIT